MKTIGTDFIILTPEDGKLFRQLVTLPQGGNNYEINELHAQIFADGAEITGVCRNEYGTPYSNDDATFVRFVDMPNFAARKLMGL